MAMLSDKICRSLLFCPATEPARMRKALLSAADGVIFDLEDSVTPELKPAAREALIPLLAEPRALPVFVRVNAADTEWHLQDMARVMAAAPDAIMLPKCDSLADLRLAAGRLDVLEAAFNLPHGSTKLLPLVTESAAALAGLDYRLAGPRLYGLGFAAEDLASSLGLAARDQGQMNPLLTQARHAVAIAAAAAGVPAFDTPWPTPKDATGLRAEAQAAALLGYGGKLLIHPAQAEIVNEVFTPSPETLAWAEAVVAAVASAGSGVALLEGRMIDIAHLRLARRTLAKAAPAAAANRQT